MMIARIEGTTRVLGQSQGYFGLPVRDVRLNDSVSGPDSPAMQTAWEPTPAELAALNAGAKVILTVMGTAHPPVMIEVGQAP